jgi:putative membrane protein
MSSDLKKESEDPRIRLAGERTLLAWIRTGLAMMGFGFVIARFGLFLREIAAAENLVPLRSSGPSLWMGIGMVVLGVVVNVMAAWQHFRFLIRLERGEEYRPSRWPLSILVAAVLAVMGMITVVYLVAVGT